MSVAARGRAIPANVFFFLNLPADEVASCGSSLWTTLRTDHGETPGSETLPSDWIENYRRNSDRQGQRPGRGRDT